LFAVDKPLTLPIQAEPSRLDTPADWHGRVPKRPLPCRSAKALAELQSEYAFFTPAIGYLYGQFHDGFWLDFFASVQQPSIVLYWYRAVQPIFAGLEIGADAEWNHLLWAVPLVLAEPLQRFINAITCVQRETQQVWRFGVQSLVILDPLAIQQRRVLQPPYPMLSITAWGIASPQGYWCFAPGDVQRQPRLIHPRSDSLEQQFAQALLAGQNPLLAIDPPRPPSLPR